MIAKGNLHAHGQKLAAYLITGKMGERAELVELKGFASSNIREAFVDVMIQAEATRCEKPFFHCYIRLPDHEALPREQWQHVADRIEKQLGFEGQGRAVAFHHDRTSGETHMHMAWSRIDLEHMRAIDPGLYKNKLKEVSRELEKELGLTVLGNDRDPAQKTQSAARNEFEQSRRLGTDLKAIRETIRTCWEQSDNGRSFESALAEHGFMLAKGDKRDFVVVDHAGGDHALGKRITGATAAQTRACLADIDKQHLPSVAQAKQHMAFRQAEHELDEVRVQLGESQNTPPAPAQEPPLNATRGEIRTAWNLTRTAEELDESLAARGMTIARVTPEEAYASERTQAFARAVGNRSQRLAEGEYVIVNQWGNAYQINLHLTGSEPAMLEKRLADLDTVATPSVAEAKDAMREAARAAWLDARQVEQDQQRPKTDIEIKIADALRSTATGHEFAARIDDAGLRIVRATAADLIALDALREQEGFDRASGLAHKEGHFATLREGDLAAVTWQGNVVRLNPQQLDYLEIEQRLADVQRHMPGVVEARTAAEIQREETAALWWSRRAENLAAQNLRSENRDAEREIRDATQSLERDANEVIDAAEDAVDTGAKLGSGLLGGVVKMAEKAFDVLADMIAPAPPPTKDQAERMERAAEEAQAQNDEEAHEAVKSQSRLDALLDQIKRDDEERAQRRREREDYDRGRERER